MALLRSVHRTPAPIYGGAVIEDRPRRVTHSPWEMAHRLRLKVPQGREPARRGDVTPGGRWWPKQARSGFGAVLAVASAAHADGIDGLDLARVIEPVALYRCGGTRKRAIWMIARAVAWAPDWTHDRRAFGRAGGLATGRVRAEDAAANRQVALHLGSIGMTKAQVAARLEVTRRTVQRYWNATAPAYVRKAESLDELRRLRRRAWLARVRGGETRT